MGRRKVSVWDRLFGKKPTDEEMDRWWEGEPEGNRVVAIHEADLVRRVLYDCGLKDVEHSIHLMGFNAQSSEVSEMSRRESDARIEAIHPILPLVQLLVDAICDGMDAQLVEAVAGRSAGHLTGLSEDALEQVLEERRDGLFGTVAAVISSLADLGLITIPTIHMRAVSVDSPEEGDDDE